MNGRRTAGGFTLIELLVTVAVITTIISVGVPMYGEFTKGAAITGRTSELIAAINFTRSEAVARRASVRLVALDATWGSGWQVVTVAAPATPLRIVDMRAARAGVVITAAGNITQLDFNSQGQGTAAMTYTLCPDGGGTGRTVAVNLFGRVRVDRLVCP